MKTLLTELVQELLIFEIMGHNLYKILINLIWIFGYMVYNYS